MDVLLSETEMKGNHLQTGMQCHLFRLGTRKDF